MTPQEFGIEAIEFFDQGLYAEGEAYENSRASALERIDKAETFDQVKAILRGQISLAGGRHSQMVPVDEIVSVDSRRPTATIDNGILHLTLPGFIGTEGQAREYAAVSSDALATPDICGVMVDLRENDGGNMGAMLGGLIALLPEGVFQTVVFPRDPTHPTIERKLVDGDFVSAEEGILWESDVALVLDPIPSVAVLTSDGTASAGELTALAFVGVEHARSFGQPTMGLVSGPQSRTIHDTEFRLTVAVFGDRTGKLYGDTPIVPDVVTRAQDTEFAARDWLQTQGCPNLPVSKDNNTALPHTFPTRLPLGGHSKGLVSEY